MITSIIKMLRKSDLLAELWHDGHGRIEKSGLPPMKKVGSSGLSEKTAAGPSAAGRLRWEHRDAGRYYEAAVQRDMFGGWVVWRCWGGIGSPRGGQQTDPAADEQAGQAALQRVAKRRQRRGYELARGHLA